jgi:hypothetical protein
VDVDAAAAAAAEAEADERFGKAVAARAEARSAAAAAASALGAAVASVAEREALTKAFEREASLEAARLALDDARKRILDTNIEPLADLLDEHWRNLFTDRPGVALGGDGSMRRRIGETALGFEQFSDGEKMAAQLILRVLVLQATTNVGFLWVDEPLEHLDPDARRALAVLLARAPQPRGLRQVVVTTYEEPLVRRMSRGMANTNVIYVRPAATV